MRKLIFAINVTLDGCCEHTKVIGHDEILGYHTQLVRDADVLLFGRKTYQLMVPYWPDVAKSGSGETRATIEFARAFSSVGKIVVFSRSLDRAEGGNIRIARTQLREEMLKLKQEPGKNILVGGVDVPSQLVELGLVDEFHFVIQPLIVGEGRRLFERMALPQRLQLKLAESRSLKSGCVALRYLKE